MSAAAHRAQPRSTDRFGAVRSAVYLVRSLAAITREPMPAPRHARRSAR